MDFAVWDQVDRLSLDEAAYLWCELGPVEGDLPSQVRAIKRMLENAIERGDLRGDNQGIRSGRYTNLDRWGRERGVFVVGRSDYVVSRESLRIWADRNGKRPRFLFPESRLDTGQDWRHQHLESVGATFDQAEKTHKDVSRRGGLATGNHFAKVKRMAREIAFERWEDEKEADKPISTITAVIAGITDAINGDLKILGIKKAPSAETIRDWIKGLAPPEISKGGRPKKT